MTISAVIFLSAFLGLCSIISTKYPYSSDRGNYVLRFVNHWDKPFTIGLNYWTEFLHMFTNDPRVLFFSISFLCMVLYLASYRSFNEAEPSAVIFLVLSQTCISTFAILKQAPSVAFAAVSIVALFNKKWFPCILFLIISISFHEAAYILVPLYIVLIGAKKRWVRVLEYVVLFACIIFFQPITSTTVSVVSKFIPALSIQISSYLDESGSIRTGDNFLTIFKGIPYYLITGYGFLRRNSLKDKIKNYDRFLVLCFFASVMCLLGAYMYWLSRFAEYAYMPMFVFASLLMRECQDKQEKTLFYFIAGGLMALLSFRYLFQMYFLYGGF